MTTAGPDRTATSTPRRDRPRVLLAGAVGNGVLGAAAMLLSEQFLGLGEFAPVAQLWTLWSLVATGLVFGVQQWEIARHDVDPAAPRSTVPKGVVLRLVGLSLVALVGSGLLRASVFGSGSWVWPLAVTTLPVGTALTGLVYGLLARRGEFERLALLMTGENVARLALTVLLGLLGAGASWYALTVPVGFLVMLLGLVGPRAGAAPGGGTQLPVAALSGVGFATSFVIFGGPVLLGVAGGAPEAVSALFLVLLPIRVPFLLANATLPAAMVAATRLMVEGRRSRLRSLLARLVAAAAAGAGVAAVAGPAVGPPLAELFFDIGGVVPRPAYSWLAAAAVLGLAATYSNVIAIALDRLTRTAVAWSLVGIGGAVLASTGVLAEPTDLAVWMTLSFGVVVAVHAGLVRGPR